MDPSITIRVRAIARSIARRAPGEVDDLIQEGMLAAWLASKRFNGTGTLGGWCSVRARGAMLDYLRKIDPITRNYREKCKEAGVQPPVTVSLDYLPYSQRCKI